MSPRTIKSSRKRVAVRWDRSLRGYVLVDGPDQSEVVLDGERQSRVFINEDLVVLPERVRGRKR